MKILHIGKFYYPYKGGMETMLRDLCTEMKDRVDLEVVVSNVQCKTVHETVEGIAVTRVGRVAQLASVSLCPAMPHYVWKRRADIVELHQPNPMGDIAYLLARPKGKLIVMYQSDIIRQKVLGKMYTPVLFRILNKADRIIVTSHRYMGSSPILRSYEDKCVVIPIGIDVRKFDRTAHIEARVKAIRQRFGDKLIIFIGRLSPYKGLWYLFDAMKSIDARLLVIGKGELQTRLQDRIASSGLQEKVILLGEVEGADLPAYLHASRLLVLPSVSRNEAFGVVQLEAFACGKPVVSTQLDSGVPLVNRDGETGFIVSPRDADALVHAINRILSNEALGERLGTVARTRVEREFSRETMAEKRISLYRDVLGET